MPKVTEFAMNPETISSCVNLECLPFIYSGLASQTGQSVTRMQLFEDLFLQVHQKGVYFSQEN